jgi:hypothetical protein
MGVQLAATAGVRCFHDNDPLLTIATDQRDDAPDSTAGVTATNLAIGGTASSM